MRIPASVRTLLAPLLLTLTLCGCGLERAPAPEASAPPAPPAQENATLTVPAAPPVLDARTVAERLGALVNDSDPASDQWQRLRAELAPLKGDLSLPASLRQAVARATGFDPPQLRERWRRHGETLDGLAALYAEHPPVDTGVLRGARVAKRLGPALYLVRLPGGDTGLLTIARRLKIGARLDSVPALELHRTRPDKAKGDLVDELAQSGRTFAAIGKDEARRLDEERAPVLARLRQLDDERERFQKDIQADLAGLDAMARDVNAVIGPRLLGLCPGVPCVTAPSGRALPRVVRQVKRQGHVFSPVQYFRYALPVTGKKPIDDALRGYLKEREKDVRDLLKVVGVGAGRPRTNTDLVAFQAFRASERLWSIRFEAQRDTGGAHPNQNFASYTFDLRTQAPLALGDLFRDLPAALALLSELADRRLELVLNGHLFAEGIEPRPENFQIFVLDGLDLVFTFPPYQAASYADGPQTLRVPLSHPRLLPLLSQQLLEALGAGT